ncbi:MAG: hypothetical protein COA42_10830 [Alteromonadaceae bacterium]|nr:MAG: hypothetical protein COA42_10830 [Alteromonadaceae bacterium]
MSISSLPANNNAPDIYTDLNALQSIGKGESDDEALKKVAKQFESMFIDMMMKGMRSANAVFEQEDSPFNSKEEGFYRDMYDKQLSQKMANGRGIGIADVMYRQMSRSYNFDKSADKPSEGIRNLDAPPSLAPLSPASEGIPLTIPAANVPTALHAIQREQRSTIVEPQSEPQAKPVIESKAELKPDLNPGFLIPSSSRGSSPGSNIGSELEAKTASTNVAAASASAQPTVSQRVEIANSPEDFIAKITPHAEKAAKRLGVEPQVLVAQAALETGWGKYVLSNDQGQSSHNLFNIKAGSTWAGDSVEKRSLEVVGGKNVMESSKFRVYSSVEQGFDDYVNFLKGGERYQQVLMSTGDAKTYIQALQDAGYATDPKYAKKVIGVYDRVAGG